MFNRRSRGIPMPVSRTRTTRRLQSVRRSRRSVRPRVYRHALFRMLLNTCAQSHRVSVQVHRLGGHATVSACPNSSTSGRFMSAASRMRVPTSMRLAPQFQLVAGNAADVQEIVEQPRHQRGLAVEDSRAHLTSSPPEGCASSDPPRFEWAPAGCATRAPASRGIRLCGDRRHGGHRPPLRSIRSAACRARMSRRRCARPMADVVRSSVSRSCPEITGSRIERRRLDRADAKAEEHLSVLRPARTDASDVSDHHAFPGPQRPQIALRNLTDCQYAFARR